MSRALGADAPMQQLTLIPLAAYFTFVEEEGMTIAVGYEADWHNQIYTPCRAIYIQVAQVG